MSRFWIKAYTNYVIVWWDRNFQYIENSPIKRYKFVYCMNSYIRKLKKLKYLHEVWSMDLIMHTNTPPPSCWSAIIFYNIYTVCNIWFSWVRKWCHKTNCMKSNWCHITSTFSPRNTQRIPPVASTHDLICTCFLARTPSFPPLSLLTHLPLPSIINHGQSSSPPHPSAGPTPQWLRYCPRRQQQHLDLYSSGRDVGKGPHSAYQNVGQSWMFALWARPSCSWPFPWALQALGRYPALKEREGLSHCLAQPSWILQPCDGF